MDKAAELELVPAAAERERTLQVGARTTLREWLAADEGDVLRAVDRIGRQAMEAAGDASARLDRGSSTESAEAVLRDIAVLAERLDPAATHGRRWWRGRDDREVPPTIDALVERLQREQDRAERALITIRTDLDKLRLADDALEEVVHSLRVVERAVDAAAREIAVDQPARAAFLRGDVAARLIERRRDVLTQLAVTRQGVLALELLIGGQEAVVAALERARQTSVAALRTALAARRAVDPSLEPRTR